MRPWVCLFLVLSSACALNPPLGDPIPSGVRDRDRVMDVEVIQKALEAYRQKNGSYPDDSGGAPTMTDGTPAFSSFMPKWPSARTPADGACTAAQNEYTYRGKDGGNVGLDATDPLFYEVSFCLGYPAGGYAAGLHVATPFGIQ
jgi:hypothetical protein